MEVSELKEGRTTRPQHIVQEVKLPTLTSVSAVIERELVDQSNNVQAGLDVQCFPKQRNKLKRSAVSHTLQAHIWTS